MHNAIVYMCRMLVGKVYSLNALFTVYVSYVLLYVLHVVYCVCCMYAQCKQVSGSHAILSPHYILGKHHSHHHSLSSNYIISYLLPPHYISGNHHCHCVHHHCLSSKLYLLRPSYMYIRKAKAPLSLCLSLQSYLLRPLSIRKAGKALRTCFLSLSI